MRVCESINNVLVVSGDVKPSLSVTPVCVVCCSLPEGQPATALPCNCFGQHMYVHADSETLNTDRSIRQIYMEHTIVYLVLIAIACTCTYKTVSRLCVCNPSLHCMCITYVLLWSGGYAPEVATCCHGGHLQGSWQVSGVIESTCGCPNEVCTHGAFAWVLIHLAMV